MISVIPLVQFKLKKSGVPAKVALPKLKELSEFVDEIANVRHDPRQPWVGQTAFAHKGGMHVHAIDRVARSYEHISPESVGNHRRVLSQRHVRYCTNVLVKAQELGFKLTADTPELKSITARIKELENEGFEFEAAEGSLALLIGKMLKHVEPPFKVDGYYETTTRREGASSGRRFAVRTVKVLVKGKEAHTVAEGDGPVNALDSALRAALVKFFPQVKNILLTDYKVRILDTSSGTEAKTRVLIESTDGKEEWGTVRGG